MSQPMHASPSQPLTSTAICDAFATGSPLAREGIAALLDGLAKDDGGALGRWTEWLDAWAPGVLAKLPRLLTRPAAFYNVGLEGQAAPLLLAMQTYYALLVGLFLERLDDAGLTHAEPQSGSATGPFAWWTSARTPALPRFVGRLRDAVGRYDLAGDRDDGECDLFKRLYQDLFPRPLRRQLGEYYTPDWLARHVLDEVGYEGRTDQRLLDPACGSGTFLVMALRRLLRGPNREALLSGPPIVGFDLNPLAVMTARANCCMAAANLLPQQAPAAVYLHDSIQDTGVQRPVGQAPFDYIVGNPPWIAWDNLSNADRQATKPLWEKYGLFSLSGTRARHGGGKKDLSMLMLYAAADRHLKPGGRLGMVITQTLFQTLAGDGFRRFQLGRDGQRLGVLRVDDLTALRPFGDAANWTSVIVLVKGQATAYPVPYFRWTEAAKRPAATIAEGDFRREACLARPINPTKPTSPWLVTPNDSDLATPAGKTPADYAAHLGANSGGANGVYWVEVLGQTQHGVRIRNSAARGKHPLEAREHIIEPDLLYPLVRWSGVERFRAVPNGCLLLVQDPTTRCGIDEQTMRARWPRTLAYLEQFRDLLASRAAYRRYQHAGPFYSMYNVGPYTTAPVKVVWRRMDRQINAAVVETASALSEGEELEVTRPHPSPLPRGEGTNWTGPHPSPLPRGEGTNCASPHPSPLPRGEGTEAGRRPVVPQETCVLVACGSGDEAHYLCAMLNSEPLNRLVAAHSVRGGKSFGTPGMLNDLPLRRYRPEDDRHRQLAMLSRRAHDLRRQGLAAGSQKMADVQRLIDELAVEVWRT